MKKIKFFLIMTTLLLFGLSANVNATPSYTSLFEEPGTIDRDGETFGTFDPEFKGYYSDNWSGYYLGTFDKDSPVVGHNPGQSELEYLARIYLSDDTFTADWYAKIDAPDATSEFLTVDYLSGNWILDNPYEIGFYAVKGGPEFAFYFVFPYTESGMWSTTHLENPGGQIPALSHLSVLAEQVTPVPEPGMVILLGIGLIGLAFYSRRRLLSE